MNTSTLKDKLLADPLLVLLMKAAKLATVLLVVAATLHFGLSPVVSE